MDARFPEFRHWGTFCDNPAAGGTTVSIRRDITCKRDSVLPNLVRKGRALCVELRSPDFFLSATS
eukprot:3283885-Heterocapsa_arctica.AAC.1